jgi:hypothetical protein
VNPHALEPFSGDAWRHGNRYRQRIGEKVHRGAQNEFDT